MNSTSIYPIKILQFKGGSEDIVRWENSGNYLENLEAILTKLFSETTSRGIQWMAEWAIKFYCQHP